MAVDILVSRTAICSCLLLLVCSLDLVEGFHSSPFINKERTTIHRKLTSGPLWSQKNGDPSIRTQLDYSQNGHAVLKDLIDPNFLTQTIKPLLIRRAREQEFYAWQQKVEVAMGRDAANSCQTVDDCRRKLDQHFGTNQTPALPFLQYFNNWRCIPQVAELAKSEILALTAARLMNVDTVRLYQDSLFWKRLGDGPTPWHVDAKMAPFDTTNFITFWIPLQEMPSKQDSALVFCSKSHCDYALPYWNPLPDEDDSDSEWFRLEERYGEDALIDYLPLKVGDATVHSGWTLHCADAKLNGKSDRLALAISYVDGRAPIRKDAVESASTNSGRGDNEDAWSYRDWVHEVKSMKRNFRHNKVPIVWPVRPEKKKAGKPRKKES